MSIDPQPEWTGNYPLVTVRFLMSNGVGASYTWELPAMDTFEETRQQLLVLAADWQSGQVARKAIEEFDSPKLPPLIELERLHLEPGDWLVATVPEHWPTDLDKLMASLTALVREANLEAAVVVLREGMTIERLGRDRIKRMVEEVIHQELTGTGNEPVGWREWPTTYAAERLAEVVLDLVLRAMPTLESGAQNGGQHPP